MVNSYFQKNKSWVIPVAVVIVLLIWFTSSYNGLISTREYVVGQWANVETQYQRRADLIPNLVETVAGFAAQEEDVFTQVTNARAKVGQVTVDIDSAESVAAFKAAQSEMSSAIARLLAVVENYPQLKSDQNFLMLQNQLEGTENRIAVARRDYNGAVKVYNVKVQRIPTVFVAKMFGFDKAEFFEADEGTEKVPIVTKDQF